MKIESLNLTNFRSHDSTTFEFDRLTFFLGPNHTGKSTVQYALEFLLTAKCPVTDEGGRGADDLILKGADMAKVGAKITVGSDTFEIMRNRTRGSSELEVLHGKNALTGRAAQDWLQKRLPSLPILSAVLNSSRFLDLPATSQKNLLSSILADDGIPVPPELRWDSTVERVSIAELDQAYKRAFERRTEVNRKLKEFEHMTPPEDVPEELPTVENIQARLRELRKERDGLITQSSARMAAHDNLTKRRLQIQRDLSLLQPRILAMEEEKRLKTLADRTDSESGEKARQLRSQVAIKREQLAKFEKLTNVGTCPTCAQAITKKAIQDVAATLKGEIAELDKKLRAADQAEIDFIKAQQYRKQIGDSIAAVGEKEALEDELSQLPEVATPDTADLDASMAELDARIHKGEGVLLTVNERRRKVDEYANKVVVRQNLDKELAQLEAMLAFAGPDGARKKATGDKLQGFNASLNTILPQFGYNALILMEPYSIQVLQEGGQHKALDVRQLSESERFRFSVAFQIALAQITGVDLIVVDHADVLDRESRKQLTGMLMRSGIGQVIVLSTSNDPIPENVPEDVKFFQLAQENGITRIAATSAKPAMLTGGVAA